MTNLCESCHTLKQETVSAVVGGIYYRHVCQRCLVGDVDQISGNAASFDRRRGYEDNAQDTIQPYDAKGANVEFARLYPDKAKQVFKPDVLTELKRKM